MYSGTRICNQILAKVAPLWTTACIYGTMFKRKLNAEANLKE